MRFPRLLIPLLLSFAASAQPGPKPRINGPKVHGVRPGNPVLYRIPATGERPMTFSVRNLPAGLKLDPKTGIISGALRERGEYRMTVEARNKRGKADREFKIVAGDTLALTPPMGWSTWYMAYANISDKLVREQADAMVSSGLADHGYQYVNIDDGWNIKPGSDDPIVGGPPRDENGNLRTSKNFPDMNALTDYVHSKGLKIGIYISPGPLTCARFEGSYGHEEQDARQFARWGFDFLKYDWCGYSKVAKDKSVEELKKPYVKMGAILKTLDRDFVYNLCQYGMGNVWEWGRETGGNFWRTFGDVGGGKHDDRALWRNMTKMGFGQAGMEKYAGPGGWNDPDNLLIGHILWQRQMVPTPLTSDEQYTYMSLWAVMAAPLVFGGDMTKLDEFTLSLLANDEVIEINQDVLGKQGAPAAKSGDQEVWVKDLEDGSKAVGLFNRGEAETEIAARWSDLGIRGRHKVRDLWRRKDIGSFEGELKTKVAPHGAALVKIGR